MVDIKSLVNIASVIFAFIAAWKWYQSSKAVVIVRFDRSLVDQNDSVFIDIGDELSDIVPDSNNKLFRQKHASLNKQSHLSKVAAIYTGLSVFFQGVSVLLSLSGS